MHIIFSWELRIEFYNSSRCVASVTTTSGLVYCDLLHTLERFVFLITLLFPLFLAEPAVCFFYQTKVVEVLNLQCSVKKTGILRSFRIWLSKSLVSLNEDALGMSHSWVLPSIQFYHLSWQCSFLQHRFYELFLTI